MTYCNIRNLRTNSVENSKPLKFSLQSSIVEHSGETVLSYTKTLNKKFGNFIR